MGGAVRRAGPHSDTQQINQLIVARRILDYSSSQLR